MSTEKDLEVTPEQLKASKKIPKHRKMLYRKFARELISNGFNATDAYATTKPQVQRNTAAANGSRLLKDSNVRAVILEEMRNAGVREADVAKRIASMLDRDVTDKESGWIVDRAITHSRAILGLDAERRSHLTVDKRIAVIHASVSIEQLSSVLSKSKPSALPLQPDTIDQVPSDTAIEPITE